MNTDLTAHYVSKKVFDLDWKFYLPANEKKADKICDKIPKLGVLLMLYLIKYKPELCKFAGIYKLAQAMVHVCDLL